MTVTLSPWQTKVWDDTHRFKVINVGRRSGKTVLSVIKLIQVACDKKEQHVWLISPTYRQSKLIAWELLKKYMPSGAKPVWNETELSCKLSNGSIISLKGADSPESLRGTHIDFAVFDEVAFFTGWTGVWNALRPILVDSKAPAWFVSTPNSLNHFYDLYNTIDPDYKSFHFTSYDNPYLEAEEIDKVRSEMTEDAFASEFLAEFRTHAGLVAPWFDRQRHLVTYSETNRDWDYFEVLDYGYSDPAAWLLIGVDQTGVVQVVDGFREKGLDTTQVAAKRQTKKGDIRIVQGWIDYPNDKVKADLTHLGIPLTQVEKASREGWDQILAESMGKYGKVQTGTGKPLLFINKDLDWLVQELESLNWMQIRHFGEDNSEIKPVWDDHRKFGHHYDGMRALAYFLSSYMQPAKEKLKPVWVSDAPPWSAVVESKPSWARI